MIVALVLKDYGMVHSRRPEPVNFGLAVDVGNYMEHASVFAVSQSIRRRMWRKARIW